MGELIGGLVVTQGPKRTRLLSSKFYAQHFIHSPVS